MCQWHYRFLQSAEYTDSESSLSDKSGACAAGETGVFEGVARGLVFKIICLILVIILWPCLVYKILILAIVAFVFNNYCLTIN